MLITDFPNEIIIIILSFINDNKTYGNCRATCISFYNILIDFKIYDNKKLINIAKFHDNKIIFYNTKNIIDKEIFFLKYGEIKTKCYNEYNKGFKELHISPPHQAVTVEQTEYMLKRTTFNFKENKIDSVNIPRVIPYPCIIS